MYSRFENVLRILIFLSDVHVSKSVSIALKIK